MVWLHKTIMQMTSMNATMYHWMNMQVFQIKDYTGWFSNNQKIKNQKMTQFLTWFENGFFILLHWTNELQMWGKMTPGYFKYSRWTTRHCLFNTTLQTLISNILREQIYSLTWYFIYLWCNSTIKVQTITLNDNFAVWNITTPIFSHFIFPKVIWNIYIDNAVLFNMFFLYIKSVL